MRTPPKTNPSSDRLKRMLELLGGSGTLSRSISGPLDVHELLRHGLPALVLGHLVGNLVYIQKTDSFEKAIGMSLRTYQRRKRCTSEPLSPKQSGRVWRFAEILVRATDVFGSRQEAELWLDRPAIGLDQRRPIDLPSTPVGFKLVETHLDRLEYGVYA